MKTIIEARKSAGFTQNEIAHKLGVTQSSINHWERGIRNIPKSRLKQLCRAYKIAMSDVLEIEVQPKLLQREQEQRAIALRFALQKIVPEDQVEVVIELCKMIIEAEA